MKATSPWKNCLLIGCVLALLGAGACGAGFYFLYHKASQAFISDPARVEALATEIFPGARVPTGYRPRFAVDMFGLQGAAIGPADTTEAEPGQCELMLVRLPQSEDVNVKSIRSQMQKPDGPGEEGGQKQLLRDTLTLSMGGIEVPVYHAVTEENGMKSEELVAVFEDREKRLVACLAMGPQEGFEKSPARVFFEGLQVKDLKVVDPTRYQDGPAEVPGQASPAEAP